MWDPHRRGEAAAEEAGQPHRPAAASGPVDCPSKSGGRAARRVPSQQLPPLAEFSLSGGQRWRWTSFVQAARQSELEWPAVEAERPTVEAEAERAVHAASDAAGRWRRRSLSFTAPLASAIVQVCRL
uniref:Uncharacterized protein n=1 Tax=Oryza sativa subsp. japonica TaxID=39947 RepID=Q7Y1C7_ORYSJ|nr:hypothetical protein [Oryza sativa Japonica Group]